ncbi:MAG: 2-oxoacid:acceptor oxidoreductase family protein [Candidatus Aenigmatarchaeota archaeon]
MKFVIIGRSGQGVSTFARVLAKAGATSGFNTQSYSEISGGIVRGYVRFSKGQILERGSLVDPEYYVVFDDDVFSFKETLDGKIVVVNTTEKPSDSWIKKKKLKVYWVDATGIGQTMIKQPYPNSALLGALLKSFNKVSMKNIKFAIENDIRVRVKENQMCVDEGYKNVK